MSLYFSLDFSPLQIACFSFLLLLLVVEILYLYLVYNKVPRYAAKVVSRAVSHTESLPSVSVVVYAYAQEAQGLLRLLPSLMRQQYPVYEVIVVTDDVSDDVQSVINEYELGHNNVYQTHVPDTMYNVSRKKMGITLGIKAAKNDVILLTEAHCCPDSDRWLLHMARNFVPGVDVVLGYTRMDSSKRGGFRTFDRLVFQLRFMAYALSGRAFMGLGSNLAYRRDSFFAHKGFSDTLNLHYGDDDLLVNALATRSNTRIEVSHESIVNSYHDDNSEAWDELRMRYNFTSRYIHSSSKSLFAMETVVHVLWVAAMLSALVVSVNNVVCLAVWVLLLAVYWLLSWYVYRHAERTFGERCAVGLVPLYHLLRPLFSLYYIVSGRKHNRSYMTWQYLR